MALRPLVIDCQVFQTKAWYRGMGRYSINLLKEAVKLDGFGDRQITLIYNQNLEQPEDRQSELKKILPTANIALLDLSIATNGERPTDQKLSSKKVLNDWAKSTFNDQPFDFLELSHFTLDYFAVFPDRATVKALIFYDLIPYILWEDYSRFFPGDVYFERFGTMFEANYLAAISQASANDIKAYLGVNPNLVKNIDGAPIPNDAAPDESVGSLADQRFVLMPTADMEHKNNLNAVEGFVKFNEEFGNAFKLVLTSFASDYTRKLLTATSDEVVFSGNVSPSQLNWMYEHAELILFPSKIEGLGLPILEAVEKKKPVACSDIEVVKEISSTAFYTFEPEKPSAIAKALRRALTHEGWDARRKEYDVILNKYSWKNSALKFVDGLKNAAKQPVRRGVKRPKLAVLCPHPVSGQLAGRWGQAMYPALSEHWEVDYYLDAANESPSGPPVYIDRITKTIDVRDFTLSSYKKYDQVFYLIDESKYSSFVLRAALAFPGVMVSLTSELKIPMEYLVTEKLLSKQSLAIEAFLGDAPTDYLTSVVNSQRGIVCDSPEISAAIERHLRQPIPTTSIHPLPKTYAEWLKYSPYSVAQALAQFTQALSGPNEGISTLLRHSDSSKIISKIDSYLTEQYA